MVAFSEKTPYPSRLRFKTWAPAAGFLGGFGWDAATLGRSIKAVDLFILLGYWSGAALLLIWLGRRPHPFPAGDDAPAGQKKLRALGRWSREQGPTLLLQFFFGGIFSALVIFYFKSAGGIASSLMVLALASLLVLNEFLGDQYRRLTLTWTLFGVCGMLFLNFALPHLFKSIHPFWFFASTALGAASVLILRHLSPGAGRVWPALAAGGLLCGLFLGKIIPPVPLVLKGLAVGRGLEKSPAGYSVRIEAPPFWAPFRRSEKRVHLLDEPLYCVSSVFMPEGIELRLYHRWMLRDEKRKEWQTLTRAGFTVSGGRRRGFRGYTFKRSLPPGRWRVAVESEDGRELGATAFEVVGDSAPPSEWRTVVLP